MLALGIIFVLAAVGLVVVIVAGASPESVTFDLGAATVSMGSIGVFVTGAVTVLLLLFGVQLVRLGLRRANRHRRDKKQLNRLTENDRTPDSTRSTTDSTRLTTDSTGSSRESTRATDTAVTDPDRPTS